MITTKVVYQRINVYSATVSRLRCPGERNDHQTGGGCYSADGVEYCDVSVCLSVSTSQELHV